MGLIMSDTVLVTGGAGYIGAHACKVLARAGFTPVTFDNLNTGWEEAVKYGPFFKGDLMNRADVDAAFAQYKPGGPAFRGPLACRRKHDRPRQILAGQCDGRA